MGDYMAKKKDESLLMIKTRNFFKKNSMLLVFLVVFVVIVAAVMLTRETTVESTVFGDDVIEMYYFHLSTCPHCHKQNAYLKYLKAEFPNLRVNEYEISSSSAKEKYSQMAADFPELNPDRISTPTTIIGTRVNVGYNTDETTGEILRDMVLEEQARIDANWNLGTMVRTESLRTQVEN